MTKISEKKLIEQMRELKEIKPRQEWVVLAKARIFDESVALKIPAQKIGFWDLIRYWNSELGISKKMAYSFVAVIFISVGLVGFANNTVPGDMLFSIKKITEQSTAALSGETLLRQNLATLNNRINDLAQVSKEGKTAKISSAMSEVSVNASALTENLKKELVADSATIKEIAVSLKTLASIIGTDLSENSEMKILYKTVVESQIADMEKSTLTEKQAEVLEEAKELYKEEKYLSALEIILTINQADADNSADNSDTENKDIIEEKETNKIEK